MKILRCDEPSFVEGLRQAAAASSLLDQTIEDRTRSILNEVKKGGDQALASLTLKFDRAKVRADMSA